MMAKSPRCPERIRTMTGSVACSEPRVLREGCWSRRRQPARRLAVCVVVVAARHGRSSSSCDKRCALVQRSLDDDRLARDALSTQDRMVVAGHLWQVLSLPLPPVRQPARPLHRAPHLAHADPATLRPRLRHSLGADQD
jgi:hypothetical protein